MTAGIRRGGDDRDPITVLEGAVTHSGGVLVQLPLAPYLYRYGADWGPELMPRWGAGGGVGRLTLVTHR